VLSRRFVAAAGGSARFVVAPKNLRGYRGLSLDDVLAAQAQYQRFTAQEVQDAFVRYDKPEARLRFVITPKS